jgi:hypothetical protein
MTEIEKEITQACKDVALALKKYDMTVAVSAMICLLIISGLTLKIDKKEWLESMEKSWDFYEKRMQD